MNVNQKLAVANVLFFGWTQLASWITHRFSQAMRIGIPEDATLEEAQVILNHDFWWSFVASIALSAVLIGAPMAALVVWMVRLTRAEAAVEKGP